MSGHYAVARLLLLAGSAAAQSLPAASLAPCDDWRSSVQAIAEPWEDNTRLFADGEVRLTVIDTGEPAAGSFFLLILSPPYDEEAGGRQCRVLSLDETMGFAGLTLKSATAQYDPASGLTVTIPATRWLPETDSYTDATLSVTLNQSDGAIQAKLD